MFIAVLSEVYTELKEENDQVWEVEITNKMVESFYRWWWIRYRATQIWERVRPSRFENVGLGKTSGEKSASKVEDEEIKMDEQDILELAVKYSSERGVRTQVDIFNLVEEVKQQNLSLQSELQEMRTLLAQLAMAK